MSNMIQDTPRWRAEGGEARRVDEYQLSKEALVFDIGGYKGDWADAIYRKFGCNVFIFEPIKQYAMIIRDRVAHSDKILTYDFGLSHETKECLISVEGDGSSIYKTGNRNELVKLVKIEEFVKGNFINAIDLIKINIEGGEYDLIDSIVDSKLIRRIGALQIQFHNFIIDADNRVIVAREKLSETHRCTYKYDYVFENWVMK